MAQHPGWGRCPVAVAGLILGALLFRSGPAAAEPIGAMSRYQMGLEAERGGNLDAALQLYQEAVQIGGDERATVDALTRIAHIQMLRRADADAEKAILGALERDPQHSEARLAQARLWLLQDKPRLAIRNFEDLSKREPVALPSLLGLIEAALVRNDEKLFKLSRTRLVAWIGQRSEFRQKAAIQARGDAEFFAAADKPDLALQLAELSFSIDPSGSSKQFLAQTLYQANQLDDAAQMYQELLPDPELREWAQIMLKQIEVQRGELQLGTKRARLRELQARAREAEIEGRLPDAISIHEEIISFGKGVFDVEVRDAEARLGSLQKRHVEKTATDARVQASELMRTARHREAAEILKRARSVVGTDLVLDGMRADALLKSSDELRAAEKESALREILEIEAGLEAAASALRSDVLAQTHAQLARILESKRLWAEAAEHYRKALEMSPGLPGVSRRLMTARLRANLPRLLMIGAVLAVAAGILYFRRPKFYHSALAYLRYQIAVRQNNREGEYHALTALAALRPHRIDWRRRLAALALEKGDQEVCLYLHEQLRRERSLDLKGMLNLYDIYEQRREAGKLYDLILEMIKESPAEPVRSRILETKFRLEMESQKSNDAFLTGRDLMAAKPSAWVAEQMVKLIRTRSAEPDLRMLLSTYRVWLRLQPAAADRIIGQAEEILRKAASDPPAAPAEPARQDVQPLTQFVLDALQKSGDLKRAADLLEFVRLSEKDPVTTLRTLLKLYSALGDPEAVFRTTGLMHEASPSNFDFGMNYAQLLEKRGDQARVESVLLTLLPHHPNSVELVRALTDRARALYESDRPEDPERAIELLRGILGRTFLDNKEIRLLLARCLLKNDRADEAIAILQAVEGGGYPRLRAQAVAAEAFLRKNQPGLAFDILSKVNFQDPQITEDLFKEMRYLQSLALEAENRLEEAAAILDELILRDITFRDVKARHERLAPVRRPQPKEECPACGKSSPAGSRFCTSCGAPLGVDSTG